MQSITSLLVLFGAAAAFPCPGDELPPGNNQASKPAWFLSFISENDNYVPARQDRHYTNGFAVSLGLPGGTTSPWLDWLGNLAPVADGIDAREYNVSLGQNLYTPEEFTATQPLPDDRPFAGWLYGELSVTTRAPGIEEHLAVNLGVVGPAAQGKLAQELSHQVSGNPEPSGWDNQLDNEPALLLRYRSSRFTKLLENQPVNVDLVTRAGLSVGNVVTEAGIGAVIRFGSALLERDIPQRLQPGLSGNSLHFETRPGRFDWLVFAGAQGRVIAHNIFLDGNTFADSLSVDSKTLGWDATAGMALTFGHLPYPVMISFSHVWRGKEFDGQEGADKFGSAQLTMRF